MDDIRVLLARQLPRYEVHSVAKLGEGWDNLVYEVNGDLVVRKSKEADRERRAESIRREAELLAVVAELSTLPVPAPIFVDFEGGVLAYRKLPGSGLHEVPVTKPRTLARVLGGFLTTLHRAPLAAVERFVDRDTETLAAWLADAHGAYREVRNLIPRSARTRIEPFFDELPPANPEAVVFCHNDLGAEHVLIDPVTNNITGVIDWADAAIADPVHDLALLYRDLGPGTFELIVDDYDAPLDGAARDRVVFYARCALLGDIAYGVRSGASRYSDAALRHIEWTFG